MLRPSPTSPIDRRDLTLVAALSAIAWVSADLAVHVPRGWPFAPLGEWDLLLTTLAAAHGSAPDAVIGAIHGGDLGAYALALALAPWVWLGLDVVVAAKIAALGFGALLAGSVAVLAGQLGGGRVGALAAGAACAVAWPGLHFELQGLNGRSPEAGCVEVAAVAAAAGGRWGLAGVASAAAVLLSPSALPQGLVLALCALGAACGRVAFLLGALAPLAGVLLLPGGAEGLAAFAADLAAARAGAGRGPGIAGVIAAIPRALEGGAHNAALTLRPVFLGAAVLAGIAALAALVPRAVREPGPRVVVAAAAVALPALASLNAAQYFYPLAYRYWIPPLALGLAAAGAMIGRSPRRRALVAAVAFPGALLASTLPRAAVAPAPRPEEAMFEAGAHRFDPRPRRDRHAVFRALFPHSPLALRQALAEGYGATLGGDAAVAARNADAVPTDWVAGAQIAGEHGAALLRGVGCGIAAGGPVAASVLAAIGEPEAEFVYWGLGRCHAELGELRGHVPEARQIALSLGLAGRQASFSVASPRDRIPPRP